MRTDDADLGPEGDVTGEVLVFGKSRDKVLRLMGKRLTAGFEVYNALNSSDVLTYDNTYALTGTNAGVIRCRS